MARSLNGGYSRPRRMHSDRPYQRHLKQHPVGYVPQVAGTESLVAAGLPVELAK